MPLFEFECKKCGHITEVIVFSARAKEIVKCEKCGSDTEKILSTTTYRYRFLDRK